MLMYHVHYRHHISSSCYLQIFSYDAFLLMGHTITASNHNHHLVHQSPLYFSGDRFSFRCFTPDFIDPSCSLILHFNFVAMLVASSAVLALKSYMSDSIDCFIPAEFKVNHDNWIKYADNYCWVR